MSGAALFLIMLLPWYGADLGLGAAALADVNTTASAWQAFAYIDLVLLLTSGAAVAGFVLTGLGHAQALSAVRAAAALGALSTLLVLYRLVDQPGPNGLVDLKYGAFLGLVATIGVTYGGLRSMIAAAAAP